MKNPFSPSLRGGGLLLCALGCSALVAAPQPAPAAPATSAAPAATPPASVRYKKGKDIDFEELLIQGQWKRPDIAVVTGNEGKDTNGLLKLREHFTDRISVDFGESVP